MRLSQAILPRALALSLAAFLFPASAAPVYTAEYTLLGCPSSTSPIATEAEQFAAITDFAQKLYIQKQFAEAFATYVAKHLINHASEVPGDGAALALKTVGPLLAGSAITLEQIFVGQDRALTYFKAVTPVGSAAAIDMFRMSGTCFVEHWVVQQPITNSTNPHPYF